MSASATASTTSRSQPSHPFSIIQTPRSASCDASAFSRCWLARNDGGGGSATDGQLACACGGSVTFPPGLVEVTARAEPVQTPVTCIGEVQIEPSCSDCWMGRVLRSTLVSGTAPHSTGG